MANLKLIRRIPVVKSLDFFLGSVNAENPVVVFQDNFHSFKEEQRIGKKELNKRLEKQTEMFIEFREEQHNFLARISEVRNDIEEF